MSGLEALGMRERILHEAARLFVTRGYDGISMREIADACGLSKAGLYYHFTDKEDLFLAILSDNLNELEGILREVEQAPASVREKIAGFVRAIFSRLPVDQRAIIRLASQEMSKISPELRTDFDRRYHEQFVGRLEALLNEGVQSGELRALNPQMAVWGLLGLMYPFFNATETVLSASTEQVTDFVLTIFFEGAQKPHG